MERKRVAIVGSGCSGLAALWALKSTKHDVHLYEAKDRLGGHTNTVPFTAKHLTTNVDTGFIVLNSATYPNFIAFLKNIGVEAVATDMTFGVSRDQGLFEWAGTSLSAVFAQKRNLLSLRMWRMIFDVIRFNQYALDLLAEEDESEQDPSGASHYTEKASRPRKQQSIGEYLDRHGYSDTFRNDYLIPMTASIWSTSPDKTSLEFPAITLVRFMWNHHLLTTVAARPTWMTIPGGSKQYIDAIVTDFPKDRLHFNSPVRSAETTADGSIKLGFSDDTSEYFDHVILATHGDTTASIIEAGATPQERKIMSGFATSRNTAVLHSDLSLMPKRRVTWSSWNYITRSPSPNTRQTVCLTYSMNILQHIDLEKFGNVLVTLNPLYRPAEHTIQGEWTYHHPLYNEAAIRSQKALPSIQNTRNISYAGAWTKYGFHEDGFSSGLKVAVDHLGATLPFDFVDSTFSRGKRPRLGLLDYMLRVVIRSIGGLLAFSFLLLRMLPFQSYGSEGAIKLR